MIKPIRNNVVIEQIIEEDKTTTGIILSNNKKKLPEAIVKAVGGEVTQVKEGDKVIYCEYAGTKVNDYLIIEEDDIIAVLESDTDV
jgi:chaperonin GroES